MKKIIILIITLTTILSAFVKTHEYADIKVSSKEEIRFLLDNGIDVMKESIQYKQKITSVQVYIKPSQKTFLESKGYKVDLIIDSRTKEEKSKGYRDNARIGVELDSLATVYPTICKRLQIGTSEEGRPIWVLKITDNIDIEEAEPEFKYTSTMHGDEVVPMEFCMEFIYDILEGYTAKNDTMNYIVDNTELYIMPLHNPDGNEAGSRYNAHGVDLNRVFPERIYGQENTPVGEEAEVAAMINWCNEHNFVLSSNMHNGAVVVNYPYDADPVLGSGSYVATPDDDTFIFISRGYADRNPSMTAYDNGITNGCAWYEIMGGMQDWNYHYYSCMEVTLEVSSTKWPSYSTIPGHWADNRDAMFWYLSAVHKGIYGVVTGSVSGVPVDATIEIAGIDKEYFTDPDHGDYYRILNPGTYSMTVSCPGFFPQTIDNIIVTDDTGVFKEATEVNVELVKDTGINNGQFTIDNLQLLQNYPNPFNPTTTISFINDRTQILSLNIYDPAGKLVEKVVDNKFTAGKYSFEFNAEKLSSGIYYNVLKTEVGVIISNKMVLIK